MDPYRDLFPFDVPGPGYRQRQVRHQVYVRRARTFEAMTDLPATLRAELAERYGEIRPEPLLVARSADGRTEKALFPDGYEAVAMRSGERRTVCVSSQVGCGFGCTFCATGQMGFTRNLRPFEIVQQVLWASDAFGGRPSNVVFMGMGEPLANLGAVIGAVRELRDGIGFSPHRITVSTVGVVPKIRELADAGLGVRLALSLHAPDDETRNTLVPLGERYPVSACLAAARDFQHRSGRRVSIEYALIAGVNDHAWQAGMLADLVAADRFHVNVIPLNPTSGYHGHSSGRAAAFARRLSAGGANVTIRETQGRDIDAACGQLAVARQERARDNARRISATGTVAPA